VRRRYNDFVFLLNHLDNYLQSRKWKRPVERLPDLPGDSIGSLFGFGRFEPSFIEDRRRGLEKFINKVANHPQCSTEDMLVAFLKDQHFHK